MRKLWAAAFLLLAVSARAEKVTFSNDLLFYGDNTEFFDDPYRVGDTTLGAYLKSRLDVRTSEHAGFQAGVFVDHRSGSARFGDPVKPILSFHYVTETSQGILGSLEPGHRHGLIDPMEVYTLELTRPMEYGGQWIEQRGRFRADLFINWQRLVSSGTREHFDYGGTVSQGLNDNVSLDLQVHGWHQGGQPAGSGNPNAPDVGNFNYGGGLGLKGRLGFLGASDMQIYGLADQDSVLSNGNGQLIGSGFYARVSVRPWDLFQVYGIEWEAHNWHSAEGDPNYDVLKRDGTLAVNRSYQELGVAKSFEIDKGGAVGELSARAHWVDDIFAYSYRVLVSLRYDVPILSR